MNLRLRGSGLAPGMTKPYPKSQAKEIADLTNLIDHNERQLFRRNIKKFVAPLVDLESELLTIRMEAIHNLRDRMDLL
jgi:hypothetical protein